MFINPSRARRAAASAFALIAALGTLSGCGASLQANYAGLGLVEITGTVSLDGQPLAHATIHFEADDRTFSYATTDDLGGYRMMFNSEKSGVLPGRKTVRIRSSGSGPGDADFEDPDANAASAARSSDSYLRGSPLVLMVEQQTRVVNVQLRSQGDASLEILR